MASKRVGYTIGSVAAMRKVHPQTLRAYERYGLLRPSRSTGNTRLYDESDLERLDVILNLTRDLGVNLAGVEVILNMREKMERMQLEMKDLFEYISGQLELDREFLQERLRTALVRVPPSAPMRRRRK